MNKVVKKSSPIIAPLWRRLVSIIIDMFISGFIILLPVLFQLTIFGQSGDYMNATNLSLLWEVSDSTNCLKIGIVCWLLAVVYFYLIPLVSGGRTIGNHIMHLVVVDQTTHELLNFKQLFLRQIVGIGILEILFLPCVFIVGDLLCIIFNYNVLGIYRIFVLVLGVISIGCYFVLKKQQFLHDVISKTQVIYVNKKNKGRKTN